MRTLSSPLHAVGAFLQDAFFPRLCGVCEKPGTILCSECFHSLPRRSSQVCGSCGVRETPSGQLCFECIGTSAHDGIFAATHYDDPSVSRLIHLFKYRFIRDLETPLGAILAESILRSEIPLPDAILPVPLHPRRERWRGWNQSALLADALTKNLPSDIVPPLFHHWLIRTRFTAPQMSIRDRDRRKRNIENAFSLNGKKSDIPFDVSGKRLWLIDDVAASGSTIDACAATLKKHGAAEVFGVVVAR